MQYSGHWKDVYLCFLLAPTTLIQQGKTNLSSSGKLVEGEKKMLRMLKIQIKPSQPPLTLTYCYVM